MSASSQVTEAWRTASSGIPTEEWTRSDIYHNSFLIPKDSVLEQVQKQNETAGLPDIAVSPAQGKFLNLLVKSIGAKRVLEVGTLGGYSTIWLARAVPDDGEVITCELEEAHIQAAKANFRLAGLESKIRLLEGPAYESLVQLAPDPPFDMAFIDADKQNNTRYFMEAKRLIRSGGIIVVDNVVRRGLVADPAYTDDKVEGVRQLLRHVQSDGDVEATTIATVGEKGLDGFMYAFKK